MQKTLVVMPHNVEERKGVHLEQIIDLCRVHSLKSRNPSETRCKYTGIYLTTFVKERIVSFQQVDLNKRDTLRPVNRRIRGLSVNHNHPMTFFLQQQRHRKANSIATSYYQYFSHTLHFLYSKLHNYYTAFSDGISSR